MDLAELRLDVRSRIMESAARYFTSTEIDRWINLGYRDFIARTEWTEKVVGLGLVAKQYEYVLDDDVIKINKMTFDDQYRIFPRSQEELYRHMGAGNLQSSERPRVYMIYPFDKKFRLFPRPSTTSATTTLSAPITTTDTTIPATSTANFPSAGRFTINEEQVLYFDKTATSFLQCVRGDGLEPVNTHDDGPITELDVQVYVQSLPAKLALATDVPEIGEEWHEALVLYAAQTAMQKRDKYRQAAALHGLYLEMVNRALSERTKHNRDEYFSILDDEIISETNI